MDSNVPEWVDYFMNIARAVSARSKDPATKVGAILIDDNNHIIGTGYNGFPPGVQDTPERWERPAKYDLVVHAEANCLLHTTKSARNAKLYTTMYPCQDCAKLIAAAGIKEVFYSSDKYKNGTAELIFKEAGILTWRV